ncbi:M14 family zinc carboxypeptidase [Streptosporangium sp. NPDC023615]|uniref:M14 family metallopeptidase n=1 Tax=Streptosporangium sp. NPDC023615 TaxID=3154794 RepID=UPI003449D189
MVLAIAALVMGLTVAPPAAATPAPPAGGDGVHVYTGELTEPQLDTLLTSGVDREELRMSRSADGKRIRVEVILGTAQADRLRAGGLALEVRRAKAARQAAKGDGVFKPYSGPGGIREQIVGAANARPDIAKVVDFGTTVKGQPLTAIKVTKNARQLRDGARKAVLYMSAQHAREWITPEMTRRLLLHHLNGYGTDPAITRLLDTTELWFVPVANPDGYDHTFTEGNRLWRKNLRDNNGDGRTTSADGVDLNRNFAYKWGYDNEGSSDNPASLVYRGPSAQSEPETRAVDALAGRVRFTYILNYHSAAQLLLYGVGWQQATPSPDDLIFEALLGDDATPAVPGYDPDLGAELYTTNGETDGHMTNRHHALTVTPEMSTCEVAVESVPDDEWTLADCEGGLGFTFPDSEALIQAEFAKNVPLAKAVAASARTPDTPVSPVGRTVPDFRPDTFTVSYGDPQPVAVTMRRSLTTKQLRFRINGGPVRLRGLTEWNGGERYGDENDEYFAEYRSKVEGAKPGDRVEVWFAGRKAGAGVVESPRFTYTLQKKSKAKVLVVANEDYTGRNPDYPASVTAPKYAEWYRQALKSAGHSSETWDVDAQGVPHHLGVLDHFKAVTWYLGDDRLAMDAQDVSTETPLGPLPDLDVKRSQQELTISVRDYLNEGGKLLHTGETAGYYGLLGDTLGGVYYGLDGAPDADCVITSQDGFFEECLILADDFAQYYLGVDGRDPRVGPTGFTGTGPGLKGTGATFGGPAVADNPLNEAGSLRVTSDTLPPSRFPQFRSWASAQYMGATGPFDPAEGDWHMAGTHADDAYMRLTRTVDLTAVSAAQRPRLAFQLSYDTEEGYDNVVVEAHTAGQDDWTTLPDVNGGTSTTVPADCEAGYLLDEHPWLLRYLTPGTPCAATGTSGSWNAFTGDSGGWRQVAFDLSAYAGKRVEVSVGYVTDPSTGGAGVFVDDTRITTAGGEQSAEGFESGLGAWTTPGPPQGSPSGSGDFTRAQADRTAAVSTGDSVFLGFGLEQVADPAERAAAIKKIMKHLIG